MTKERKRPWIILMSHGKLALELKKSAELILGELTEVYCLSLEEEMEPMILAEQLLERLEAAPENTIIFTDLFGGTPSNIAAKVAVKKGFNVVSGLNLPLLIEAEMTRYKNEEVNIDELVNIGRDSIKDIQKVMEEREENVKRS